MSYDSLAQNKFSNNAIELVIFRTGPNNYIYSSTHTKELIIGGQTYLPFPFNRGERKINNAFEDSEFKIVVNPDHPICSHYRTMPTNYDVSVIVRQGYLDDNGNAFTNSLDTDYPILGFGWVGSADFDTEDGQLTLSVVTVGDTLAAPTLTRYFQASCPLRLYGALCKAERKFITVAPVSVMGNTLTLAENWSGQHSMSDFIGGLISFITTGEATEFRMISSVSATQLRFVGSSQNLTDYTSVQLALGCPHTLDGCRDLHDNSRRYGGFPWQPLDNPVNKSVR